MIIRKSTARARQWRFGQSGDLLESMPEDFGAFLLGLPGQPQAPLNSLPLIQRVLARVALLVSARVADGFAWHNACLELKPANWKIILEQTKPDYLLVESCFYDSARAWPLLAFNHDCRNRIYQEIVKTARKSGIPSIFWHTLGPEMLPYFLEACRAFDIIACAESESIEILKKKNIEAALLPYAFSPEQFNPLSNPRLAPPTGNLIFDGIGSMLRFPKICSALEYFKNLDLAIVDSGMITPEYNLRHFYDSELSAKALGNISQTRIQDVFKNSAGYLSLSPEKYPMPLTQWRSLEAAACRLPVLHVGKPDEFMASFAEIFANAGDAAECWREMRQNPLARERAGHLAWRKTHQEHTFAKRMAQIHRLLDLPGDPFPVAKASIITPSIRSINFPQAMRRYEDQTWPNKEFVYVFNGPEEDAPILSPSRDDIHIMRISQDHATGMAMNAGIMAARGEYIFRMDDDDLYGADYVGDRMIYFREFNVDSLSNARAWFTFGDSGLAAMGSTSKVHQDNTVAALGSLTYQILNFPGGTWSLKRSFALRLGFTGGANAWADVAFLLKGMFFAINSAHIKTDAFNFCVRRNNPEEHTWSVSKAELKSYLGKIEVPLGEIFV